MVHFAFYRHQLLKKCNTNKSKGKLDMSQNWKVRLRSLNYQICSISPIIRSLISASRKSNNLRRTIFTLGIGIILILRYIFVYMHIYVYSDYSEYNYVTLGFDMVPVVVAHWGICLICGDILMLPGDNAATGLHFPLNCCRRLFLACTY